MVPSKNESWFSSFLRIFKSSSRPKEHKEHKVVKRSSSTGNLKQQNSNSKKDAAATKKTGKLRSVSSDHRLGLGRTKSLVDPREAEKSRAVDGQAIDLLPPLPTTETGDFTLEPFKDIRGESGDLKTTTTLGEKIDTTITPHVTATTTTTNTGIIGGSEADKNLLGLDFVKDPQDSSFLSDIMSDIPIGLVSQISDSSNSNWEVTPAVETKPKQGSTPTKVLPSAKDSTIADDNDVSYLNTIIDDKAILPDLNTNSSSFFNDVVSATAAASVPITAADKTEQKNNELSLGVKQVEKQVGNTNTTDNLVSNSTSNTASPELPATVLHTQPTQAVVDVSTDVITPTTTITTPTATAVAVDIQNNKKELLVSHIEADANLVQDAAKPQTSMFDLENSKTSLSTAADAVTKQTNENEQNLAGTTDEPIFSTVSDVVDTTPDKLQSDIKVQTETIASESEIAADASSEDWLEPHLQKSKSTSTVTQLDKNAADDEDSTNTEITELPELEKKGNSEILKITTTNLDSKKDTDVKLLTKDSDVSVTPDMTDNDVNDGPDLSLLAQSTPELGNSETLETVKCSVSNVQKIEPVTAVPEKALNDSDETMEFSSNSLFSISPTSDIATPVGESFDSRNSSFDELHGSKPKTVEIVSELEGEPPLVLKSSTSRQKSSKKTRKSSGSKSKTSVISSPSAEIKLLDPQPEVLVYTSYASGTLHVVPQTRRIQQILEANHIKHSLVELSTDTKAKRNWKWNGNGKNIPCVVRDNHILADLKSLEELNEKNLVYQKIVVEELY